MPWSSLVAVVEPYDPHARTSRPSFGIETRLRIHCLQRRLNLSDPAMDEAPHDMPLFREFARRPEGVARLPDQTTILRFHHLLEKHDLATDRPGVVNDVLQARA